MNALVKITNKACGLVSVSGLYLKKHAPTILTATGLVSMIAGTVLACKGTIKAQKVIQEYNDIRDVIEEASEITKNDVSELQKYTPEDIEHDKQVAIGKLVVGMIKSYAPTFIFTSLGLAAIISSNVISKKRYMAMAAAYEAVNTAYQSYRNRVKERFGEEIEQDIFLNRKITEIKEKDLETGESMVDTIKLEETPNDPYTFLYDEVNSYTWTKDVIARELHLESMQRYWNDKLRLNKFVTLNQVLESLGFRTLPAYGQIVGWIDRNPNSSESDGFVDFGLTNIDFNHYAKNDRTAGWWLTFNCDGNIYDLIDKAQERKVI